MSEMTLAQTRASAQALLDMPEDSLSHPLPGLARELLQDFIANTGPSADPAAPMLDGIAAHRGSYSQELWDAEQPGLSEPAAAGPVEPILQFFAFAHLPPHLQTVSANFASLAHSIVDNLPRNPERTVALRKLLEAKDAAVRARLYK